MITGRWIVEIAGVPEAIALVPTPARMLRLYALRTNTGLIYVGHNSEVRADAAYPIGEPLFPGQYLDFTDIDLQDIWIDVVNSGEGVTWRGR